MPDVPRAWKSFWSHLMALLGDVGQMEAHFCFFEIILIKTQDRWMVCAEHVIGSEIILGAPDGTPR
jgi:hypothetical protein